MVIRGLREQEIFSNSSAGFYCFLNTTHVPVLTASPYICLANTLTPLNLCSDFSISESPRLTALLNTSCNLHFTTSLHSICLSFFLWRQGLAVVPRLECSGAITAHNSLDLLGSSNPPTAASGAAFGAAGTTQLLFTLIYFSFSFPWHLSLFFLRGVSLCRPSWSTMTRIWLTATSTSQVQAILLPPPPE